MPLRMRALTERARALLYYSAEQDDLGQEIGNYRNLALIGLALAQGMIPQITALEQRQSSLTASVAAENSNDHAQLAKLRAFCG